jgi:hypothetical protein
MNPISERDVQQHITILGWLYIAGHAIFLVVGAFVFLLLINIAAISGDAEAMTVLSIVGTSVGLLLAVLGIPGVIAGYGLLTRKRWARILTLVVGILGLMNFPLGTAIGVYTFWVLTQPAAAEYFGAPAPARPRVIAR